ncbi:hypothetical protein Ae201684P_010744 [Aphanomyces euteiches]|nr:hypothetical protein Ae201684P_010744 [Aphanomyces euteiches]
MDLIQFLGAFPVATAAAVLVMAGATTMLYYFVHEPATNPLNALPGPKSSHWFFGSLKEIMDVKWRDGHFPEPMLSWVKKYGGAVHYRATLAHRVSRCFLRRSSTSSSPTATIIQEPRKLETFPAYGSREYQLVSSLSWIDSPWRRWIA